jgi:hypothetical protein
MTTPQSFAITVPHASSQLALGRCACPNGASLATVGSILVDAVGTLTAQSDGAFTAQTNTAMSWLSQAGTQAHSTAKIQVFAGGGVAPGACGSGAPASSPGSSTPAETSEHIVNATLSAASLARNVVDFKGADGAAAKTAQVMDGLKNAAEGLNEVGVPGAGAVAPYFEMASGVAGLASMNPTNGKLDVASTVLGAAATIASGAAGAAGAGADLEERAVSEIKMVAGTMITGSAGVGFDYKTLNKFSVTAGALTSFTTVAWGAFCLLKYEVKAGWAVKAKTALIKVDASKSATMDAKAKLTFMSPIIDYKSKMLITKTLKVNGNTQVKKLQVKQGKKSVLRGELEVKKNANFNDELEVKKDSTGKKDTKVKKKKNVRGSAKQKGVTKIA